MEGLSAYAAFVSGLIHIDPPPSSACELNANTAPRPDDEFYAFMVASSLYFVAALTALFESICGIVNQHQSIVTKHYGKDKMLFVVRRLVEESDAIVHRLLDNWEEERNMKRKVIPLCRCKEAYIDTSCQSTLVASSPIVTVRDQSNVQTQGGDSVDPRDIDKILNETSSLIVRFSAFRRFLYNNSAVSHLLVQKHMLC